MDRLHRLQNILFLVTLGLLQFNVRYIFNFEQISSLEGFREHLTWSIFAFDIPLGVLIALIIYETYSIFMYSMKKDQVTYEVREYSITRRHIVTLFKKPLTYLVIILLISSAFSQNKGIAIYNSYRIILAAALFTVAAFLFRKHRRLIYQSSLVVFISGVFQALLAIFQALLQRSLSLGILGESVIAPDVLGVAKFEFASQKFIRAYGTFPHPNVLGFFLLFALAAGFWLIIKKKYKNNLFLKISLPLGMILITLGILFSYSRSIVASTLILLLVVIVSYREQIIDAYKTCCSKMKIHYLFQGMIALSIIFATLFVTYNVLAPRLCITGCEGDSAFDLRVLYNEHARSIIAENPLIGVGPGNFVPALQNSHEGRFAPWEIQPVHNVYLLITSEVGLVGLVVFLSIIVSITLRSQIGFWDIFKNPFVTLFFLLIFIGFLDHYFWTLPQGQALFWLALAFFQVSGRIKKVAI